MTLEVGDVLSSTQRVESLVWLKSRGWKARDNTGACYYQRGPGHGTYGPPFSAGLWTLGAGSTHILKPWPDPPADAKPRKRIAAVSTKRAAAVREAGPVREAVHERDGGCVLRHRTDAWGPCWGPLEAHHIHKDSAGGEATLANHLSTCRLHNQDIEREPESAKAFGLVVNHAITPVEAYRRRELHGIGVGTYPGEGS